MRYEGGYLNGKRHGKGKEYYDGELFFDGEYLNGKKHGEGKEYDSGNLMFEGKFLNNKRWDGVGYDDNKKIVYKLTEGKGYIKEIYNGIIHFEGEILNGERNGKGKLYDKDGDLRYEGNYINDNIIIWKIDI